MPTTTMNISLPESLKAFIDERLENYGSASEYVRELIRADQKRVEHERLEKLLLERLESGNEQAFDMGDVRREVSKRLSDKR
jgi:antitoxin ParD1/3/4